MAKAATKARKAPSNDKTPAKAKSASRAPVEEPSPQGSPSLPARAIEHEAIAPEDRLLSPKVVAAMLGVSEKWLSAAREGRKSIQGPPYQKLGDAARSPVRYNLAALRDWLAKRPQRLNTHGATVTKFASASEFFTSDALGEPWLFAEVDGELIDIFVAINGGVFERKPETPLRWLTSWEWLKYSAATPSMSGFISSALSSIRGRARSAHEERVLEQAIPKAAPNSSKNLKRRNRSF